MNPLLCPLSAIAFAALCVSPCSAEESLDAALDGVAPELKKWGTVCVVTRDAAGVPSFTWTDYRDTGAAQDFWPASTIKLYAALGALEWLEEAGFPLDTTVTFSHREAGGTWVTDCARTVREMLSEVFRRSSNEDYTLLLRMTGVDRLNTRFLIPDKGFSRSAIMRGYESGRPWAYRLAEPQQIRLTAPDGKSLTAEHTWTGRFYAEERGCTVIDRQTGNVTTPRELGECLRRVLYHHEIPMVERYQIADATAAFLQHGGGGFTGLETRGADSGPTAWTGAVDQVFPKARFYHKCGLISNFALEAAAVDDTAQGGPEFLLVPVVNAGISTRPVGGEALVSAMSRRIAEWVRDRRTP